MKKNVCTCINWITLPYSKNEHNAVNQVDVNKATNPAATQPGLGLTWGVEQHIDGLWGGLPR